MPTFDQGRDWKGAAVRMNVHDGLSVEDTAAVLMQDKKTVRIRTRSKCLGGIFVWLHASVCI